MSSIDAKIKELLDITNEFLFVEYYPHSRRIEFKILNEYTKYGEEKLVLCPVEDGIERALDIAIEQITKGKAKFEK